MEIMGLIVIVVLLTLGMFFVVSFKTQQPTRTIKQSFDDDQLASNFIISFLKTNTECRLYTIQDMIEDCTVERRIMCEDLDSCQYVNRSAEIFLNETLAKWEKKYKFEIEGMKEEVVFESNCKERQEKDVAFQPMTIWKYHKTVIIKLDVCE